MRRFSGLLIAAVSLTTTAYPQTQPKAPAPQPTLQSTLLPANTPPVVLDVIVQNKDGHPVRGLQPEDFRLTEDNVPQTISQAVEHSALAPVHQGKALPTLPPGTFTDYTPVPTDGTLDILLLDALNTPAKNQNAIRSQLQQYALHADPGTRIAIFGLANRLILLQGFTSNPDTLKNILNHKLIPRSSSLLNHPPASSGGQQTLSPIDDTNAPSMAQLAANLQQFEAQTGVMETQLRAQFTLDALNTLGHYLSAFSGRKNLIWFSGSFPVNFNSLPDPKLKVPVTSSPLDEQEYKETSVLLTQAQVAIYPVNALGLTSQPASDPATSRHDHAANPANLKVDLKALGTTDAAEHATMDLLASETGGRAFYDPSSLASAVADAISNGANYYNLTYSPTNTKDDGSYHGIHVSLAGNAANRGLQLAYRQGYYTASAMHLHPDIKFATPTATNAAPPDPGNAYVAAAMSRGAPTPQNLLFQVRVLPASTGTQSWVAPNNILDPSVSPKGPFRLYDVYYASLPNELTLGLQPDGRRTGHVEFLTYVFDVYGRLLNATGKTFLIQLTPADYDRFTHSAMECRMQISVPTSKETFIRVGIRDVPSNKFGVVEIPTADISHLAPASAHAKPATAPSTPQPPSAVPSTPPSSSAAPASPPPS